MKKSILLVISAILVGLWAPGCATFHKKNPEIREVRNVMEQWKQAMLANDLEKVLSFYSDNFTWEGKGKAALADELKTMFAAMKEQDGWINVEDATIQVDDDCATVVPVAMGVRSGVDTVRFNLQKIDGTWKIIGMSNT